MPHGIFWNCYDGGGYDVIPIRALEDTYRNLAREWDARLETFTRCQETTEIYVSIIDEMVSHMGIINDTSTDLRAIGIARESIGLAKQKMERVK